jgi:superfamily I DNA/RNA helicase
MVDEVQVASENELKLMSALATGSKAELFMAGDDEEGILTQGFSFASAGVHLQHGFPGVLNGNYRNSRQVGELMNLFAAKWPSAIQGRQASASRGLDASRPTIVKAANEFDEVRWVASRVTKL